MNKKTLIIVAISAIFVSFLVWRFIRPMNIFVVTDKFAWPVETTNTPAVLGDLSAKTCGVCHREFYQEWQTAIHSKAWTEPYFQADWNFDSKQHVCRLCHTPLDRQQPHKVLGYRDGDKWDPILENNPDFSPSLQHEGVTCAACHYRDGKIVGVFGNTNAPHPVKKIADPNQVCVRCHVVSGEKWDTFFKFPPCGTVAEIKTTSTVAINETTALTLSALQPLMTDNDILQQNAKGKHLTTKGATGESTVSGNDLGCVQCHMPVVERPLVAGGIQRTTRHHYWRGGHDPEMVKKALSVNFAELATSNKQRRFELTMANTGAAHYVPTGTPDRYLEVQLRIKDKNNTVISEETTKLIRRVMWRPFIIDLTDSRLPRWQPQTFTINVANNNQAYFVEALVSYHLLDESRRKRINYNNTTPISYEVFNKVIKLH